MRFGGRDVILISGEIAWMLMHTVINSFKRHFASSVLTFWIAVF